MIKRLCLICGCLVVTVSAFAASNGPVENIHLKFIDGRLDALGTPVALEGEAGVAWINPALLYGTPHTSGTLGSQSVFGAFSYTSLATSFSWEAFKVGVAYGNQSVGNITETTREDDRVRGIGSFGAGFHVFQGTLAMGMPEVLGFQSALGVNGRIYSQYIGSNSRLGFGGDVGFWGRMPVDAFGMSNMNVGLVATNPLSFFTAWPSVSKSDRFRFNIFGGVVVDTLSDQLRVSLHNTTAGGAIGAEYALNRLVAIRGSVEVGRTQSSSFGLNQYGAGVGLTLPNVSSIVWPGYQLRFDYAMTQPLGGASDLTSQTLSLTLVPPSPKDDPAIRSPKTDTTTTSASLMISGTALPEDHIDIFVNDLWKRSVRADAQGNWQVSNVSLDSGRNVLYVKAVSDQNSWVRQSKAVVLHADLNAPHFDVSLMPSESQLRIQLQANRALTDVTATMNGKSLPLQDNGELQYVAQGNRQEYGISDTVSQTMNTLTISGRDQWGRWAHQTVPFWVSISTPANRAILSVSRVQVAGAVTDIVYSVLVQQTPVVLDENRLFTAGVALLPGRNRVPLTYQMASGQSVTQYLEMVRLASFSDVMELPLLYRRAIEQVATLGVLKGTSDTTFSPEGQVTRGQFAVSVADLLTLKPQAIRPFVFKDVPPDTAQADAIQALVENRIMDSKSATEFGTDDAILITQAVAILKSQGLLTQPVTAGEGALKRRDLAYLLSISSPIRKQITDQLTWPR
jgi:hypothetical protein